MPQLPATHSAPQLRGALQRRVRRVRGEAYTIAQTALAAGGAWAIASLLHPRPFFAPVAAVIALGIARGRRTVRAVELVIGVAVGVGVADLLVTVLGPGPLAVVLVVAFAMSAALLLGAGTILVNQAAVSAIIAVATVAPGSTPSPSRVLDALIGGAFALLVGQVLLPRDPSRMLAKAARPVVSDLAVALEAVAGALREGDPERAEHALAIARGSESDLDAFYDAVALARETVALPRRGGAARGRLPRYAAAARQMDYAVRNTRVLARRAAAATRRHGPAPSTLADAVSLLGEAVLELGSQLEDPSRHAQTRRLALAAAAQATALLEGDPNLSLSVIIGQVRSTAIDLLRGSGMSADQAARELARATEEVSAG